MESPEQAQLYDAIERLRPRDLDADIRRMVEREDTPTGRRAWLALQVERKRRRH